jgi:hypothetical protein
MMATCSSETLTDFKWLHSVVTQETTLHNHRCENLKSHEMETATARKWNEEQKTILKRSVPQSHAMLTNDVTEAEEDTNF